MYISFNHFENIFKEREVRPEERLKATHVNIFSMQALKVKYLQIKILNLFIAFDHDSWRVDFTKQKRDLNCTGGRTLASKSLDLI